jgi:hypothetical protein
MKRGQTVSRFLRWSVHASSWPLRIQVTALIFFFVLASVEVVWGTAPIPPQLRLASIEGTVVDSTGFPVAGATVYVFKHGRTPSSTTNAKGYFVLNEIEVGEHRIFAYKESDRYPNPVWSFYSDALGLEGFPVVYVHRGGSLQGIIVRLPPKSSRLTVKINDARTHQALEDATVSVNHEGKPKTEFSAGATSRNGELAILVPPGIAINMKIRRSGYNTSYRSGIQLRAGEERTIEINLTRTNRTSR